MIEIQLNNKKVGIQDNKLLRQPETLSDEIVTGQLHENLHKKHNMICWKTPDLGYDEDTNTHLLPRKIKYSIELIHGDAAHCPAGGFEFRSRQGRYKIEARTYYQITSISDEAIRDYLAFNPGMNNVTTLSVYVNGVQTFPIDYLDWTYYDFINAETSYPFNIDATKNYFYGKASIDRIIDLNDDDVVTIADSFAIVATAVLTTIKTFGYVNIFKLQEGYE